MVPTTRALIGARYGRRLISQAAPGPRAYRRHRGQRNGPSEPLWDVLRKVVVRRAGSADADSFDHLPTVYDRFAELSSRPLVDHLDHSLPLAGDRAVDIGCGTGVFTTVLADRYRSVLAVDVCEPMLELAQRRRSRPNVQYARRSLTDLSPDEDGRFDLVFSSFALHHAGPLPPALDRIRGLVGSGGLAILVDIAGVPHGRWWFRAHAAGTLAVDLVRRRRRRRDAADFFRATVHPAWLDHLAADQPLSPAEFNRCYLAAFPGAVVTPLGRSRAVRWSSRSAPWGPPPAAPAARHRPAAPSG